MKTQDLLGCALLLFTACSHVHSSPLSNVDKDNDHKGHHDDNDHDGEHDHDNVIDLPHSLAEILHQHEGHHGLYNPSVKPDGQVKVNMTMFIQRLGRLYTDKNELDLQLTYRENFIDQRLAGHAHPEGKGYVNLIGNDVAKIWTPDTFIRNSIESHVAGAIKPNAYARIYPDGKVRVSRRLDLKVVCPDVKAQLLSGNEAVCPIGFASYGYEETDLEYSLNDEDVQIFPNNPINLGQLNDKAIEFNGFTTDSRLTINPNSGARYMSVKLNLKLGLQSS